jgi:hypothetical protein
VFQSALKLSGCPAPPEIFMLSGGRVIVFMEHGDRSGGLDVTRYSDHMPDLDPVAEVEMALDALDVAYKEAVAAVRAVPDPEAAFPYANELSEKLRELSIAAAALRTETAARIWDSKRMTLAALADRIGVSTTRAHQLIKGVRKNKEPGK